MALSSYTELQATVADYLNRSDLTTQIVDFIALFEAKFNRTVRHPEMLTRDDAFTVDSQYETLPTGHLETKVFNIATAPIQALEYASSTQIMEWRQGVNTSGTPRWYTISGANYEFLPVPSGTFTATVLYWQRVDALATTSPNWLLTKHPDIYLYGTLCEAEPFIQNDERLPVWMSLRDAALQELKIDGQRQETGSRPIRTQTRAIG